MTTIFVGKAISYSRATILLKVDVLLYQRNHQGFNRLRPSTSLAPMLALEAMTVKSTVVDV